MAWVYILQSLSNNRYYIGSTDNLDRRIQEHNRGKSKATKGIRPLKLVFSQKFPSLQQARKVEHQLKRLKSRVIIEKIIKEGIIRIVKE